MTFDSFYTNHYRLPYFGDGHAYSAEADRQRFVTLDRNLESYVGIVGIGVVQGWSLTHVSGLAISMTWGDGFVNGYYSESGWVVKKTEDVLPADNVLQASYYVDSGTGQVYDKIEHNHTLSLPDNSDVFLYAYRNSNYLVTSPYLEPDNSSPVAETGNAIDPSRSAVSFAYAGTKSAASQSGRVFIGLVVTRSGLVTDIDVSEVRSLASFSGSIKDFADYVIKGHTHGGSDAYDPPAIRLQTDRRDMILESAVGESFEFVAKNSDVSTAAMDHYHTYTIDDSGDGITIDTYGSDAWHFHDISNFTIEEAKGSVAVDSHSHELSLPEENADGWSQSDPVQIYINAEPYYGQNATVDAANKKVTFIGDVTVKFRKYGIDHEGWIFEDEERSLYRFMLKAALAYGAENDGTNIIVPDSSLPISVLKNQTLAGDSRLVSAGDTFVFVPDAANDVTVTLLEEAHVDQVEIEILTNSEVSGLLPQDNILYIPASKIVSGQFEPEIIPMLSHLGRFLEGCSPRTERIRSVNGRIYESERDDIFGNVKLVHSAADDGYGSYILGTSDGVYRKPAGGAYLFTVNGVRIITDPGDIRARLEEASLRYQAKTGTSIIIDSEYDDQIDEAVLQVVATGDYYSFIGNRNEAIESGFDSIWLFFVEQYKLEEYGYETTKSSGEILLTEEIIREIDQEIDPEAEEQPPPVYLVKNDFHKWTPKKLFIEKNLASGYDGSFSDKFFSVTSSGIFTSTSVDREWRVLTESGINGYIYDFSKSYSGVMAAVTSDGIKVSMNSTGTGFRHVKSPVFGYDPRAVMLGYGDRIIIASSGSIITTDNYGVSWLENQLSQSDILHIFHDPSLDSTTTQSGHAHSMSVNTVGTGQTSEDVGHYHVVVSGLIQEASGHTHEPLRTFYAMSRVGELFKSSNGGITWTSLPSVQDSYSEWGGPFAAFGDVYVPVVGGIAKLSSGSWEVILPYDELTYSAQWSYDNDVVLLGTNNALYSFDGTTATEVFRATGGPVPKLYRDLIPKMFGFVLNNAYSSYDMGGDILLGTNLDVVDSFEQFYPEQDGWPDGVEYDLYINDKLVKSTKKGVDRSGETYIDVSNVSVINFSTASTLSSAVEIGDIKISLADASLFPQSGTVSVLFAKNSGELFADKNFYNYYAKSGNDLLLSSPSLYSAGSDLVVSSTPEIDGNDIVKITVYDGKLDNVGINTHDVVEDLLSIESTGLPSRLGDVYESNLLHLTIAAKYIFPSVDSEFENSFITTFDYNFTPGDPQNIDEHIDRTKSDLASLAIYSRDDLHNRSSVIRRVVRGFGSFVNYIFVASNVGLFMMDSSSTFENNWQFIPIDDDSSEAYDILQHDGDTLFVATDNGMYTNISATLESWTQIAEEKIGGIPTRIVPRWNSLVDEELGIDYWWGDWNGIVHQNESLINTIIVSGDGFLSHSDDRGLSWLDGKLYDTSNNVVEGMSPVSYTLLRNGSIAVCAKNLAGTMWGIYSASGAGSRWEEIYSISSVYGSISSMRVEDNLNVIMLVTFNADSPADNSLVGRNLVIGSDSYVIIANSDNYVTVFGDSIVDSTDINFEIRPWKMNSIHEDSEKRLTVGSSIGMLWDNGGFFSAERKRDGRLSSIGNVVTVESMNISGSAELVIPFSEKTIISASVDKHVIENDLVGMVIKFASSVVPDLSITANGTGRHDGTVSITVVGDASAIVDGDIFVIEGVETLRVYVSYEATISQGDLDGGYVVIRPDDNDLGLPRADYPIMKIVSNTDSYIDISREFEGPDTVDPISDIIPGSVLLASNGDGRIPVNVQFDTQRGVNEIRNNTISISGSVAFPVSGEAIVYENDEISMVVEESYSVEDNEYSVFNTLISGEEFSLSSLPFAPRQGFNDLLSSPSFGHYHTYDAIPGPITGVVTSFGTVTSYSIELLLADVQGLDYSTLISNPNLFEGDVLLVYRNDNQSIKYRLEIVSHNTVAESITVSRKDDVFDLMGDDDKKVGGGYSIILSTNGYGSTLSTKFTNEYVVNTIGLTADALINDNVITVSSTNEIGPGVKLRLTDDTGVSFTTEIVSIAGFDVTIDSPLIFDLLISTSARAEVLYGKWFIGQHVTISTISVGDITLDIADVSDLLMGDVATVADGSGRSDQHIISSIDYGVNSIFLNTSFGNDYSIGATVTFERYNHSESHDHVVKKGGFSLYELENGSHGHYLSPLIQEVVDIKTFNGTAYAVGSGSIMYYSSDNGETWQEMIDLSRYPEFTPVPSHVNGVYLVSDTVVACSTSSGYIVYQSDECVRFIGTP